MRTLFPALLLLRSVPSLIPVVGAILSCLLFLPSTVAGPDQSSLVVLPLRDLGMEGSVSAAALSADGRRLYLGTPASYRLDRRNLVVVTLDAAGKLVGKPRRYVDGTVELPEKTHATITALLVDAAHRKLYVTRTFGSSKPVNISKLLTVWDLDEQGEPTGTPRSYECGNPHKDLQALARHPRHPLLYLVGWGGQGVYVYRLDEQGWPTDGPKAYRVGDQGKYEIAVSADGKRLYLGTYPDKLEIVDLDNEGLPTGKRRFFTAGEDKQYLRFQYSPKALYLRRERRETAETPRLASWPLDEAGKPVGKPKIQAAVPVGALMLSASRQRLWVAGEATLQDIISKRAVVTGVQVTERSLDPNGMPTAAVQQRRTLEGETAVQFAVGDGGRTVLLTKTLPAATVNRVRGERLRVTLLDLRLANGQTPAKAAAVFRATDPIRLYSGPPKLFDTLQPGKPTEWFDLDPYLKNRRDRVMVTVGVASSLTPGNATAMRPVHLRLRVEIAAGDPDHGGRMLKSWTDTVDGDSLLFFLPGYAYLPVDQRRDAFESVSEHSQRYLDAARAIGLKPEERPQQFIVSCHLLMGGQGHREQLLREVETVGLLGFNTVNAHSWGEIPSREINTMLKAHGLKWRIGAAYNPPSYFDYARDRMNPPALDRWAKAQVAEVSTRNGGSSTDVVMHYLADEPGWYFPAQLEEVRNKPEYLEAFRAYLREQKLQPADLGQPSWEKVFPIGASARPIGASAKRKQERGIEELLDGKAKRNQERSLEELLDGKQVPSRKAGAVRDLPSRKLFYWTMRFFAESASRGHRLATEALERAYGHRVLTPVNWNNWTDRWYVPSPNQKIAHNEVVGPDSAMGGMDWLDAGRRQALTPWTEDWFPDQRAQTWSYFGDLLRSSAELGSRDFGGYVIGGMVGNHPAGARLKTLALIGHGAKAVDFYAWGPEFLFPGNCWSESWRSYRPIADAIRSLGRAERLLYPGRRERGKVAIFLTTASGLWDTDQHETYYQQEIGWLHTALIHAGYTVDFVDDTDIARDALAARSYHMLYLTAPNVAAAAAEKIATWVEGGGTLAVTPGAGVADEYNTPSAALTPILGLKPRQSCRTMPPPYYGPLTETERPVGRLTALAEAFGSGELPIYGPRERLDLDGAKVVAHWKDSAPAITLHKHGKGRAIAYGFFPGWQYWQTPDRRDMSHLPRHWDSRTRQLAVAPTALAQTPRPVLLDRPVVEACRLQSAKGIAIVLLNWTDEPIERLTVTIPAAGSFRKITSIQRGELPSKVEGDSLRLSVPLKDTDILLIE